MSRHRIEVYTDCDEVEEICLDGVVVARTNHDEHGWSGMEIARNLARRIAEVRGWSYQEGLTRPDPEETE